jgi:hypothetical protein
MPPNRPTREFKSSSPAVNIGFASGSCRIAKDSVPNLTSIPDLKLQSTSHSIIQRQGSKLAMEDKSFPKQYFKYIEDSEIAAAAKSAYWLAANVLALGVGLGAAIALPLGSISKYTKSASEISFLMKDESGGRDGFAA